MKGVGDACTCNVINASRSRVGYTSRCKVGDAARGKVGDDSRFRVGDAVDSGVMPVDAWLMMPEDAGLGVTFR
jgi:hypothetical protein